MGWSGGSRVFDAIILVLQDEIGEVNNDATRERIYTKLIELFEDEADCDTLGECQGADSAFDKVWNIRYKEEE